MTAEQHCSGHGAYNAYCASCVNLRLVAAERVVEALIQLHGTDCYIENEYGHSCDQFRAIMAAANAADLNSTEHE